MQHRLSKIVVGIDGSELSKTALTWACRLARAHDAEVEAVRAHAHPISPLIPALGASQVSTEELGAGPREQLTATVARAEAGYPVHESVVMRSPQFALEQASQNADLLVLGRTGRGRLENLLIGSVSGYCAHHCACPVAVVGQQMPAETVLVAVDGSDRSIGALTWALETWPLDNVSVAYSHDESLLDELALDDEHRAQLEGRARKVLDDAVDQACAAIGVEPEMVRTHLRSGDPRTTIVDAVAPRETLLLGTQGHGGFAGWVLGSLADYALRRANGTVIIWR